MLVLAAPRGDGGYNHAVPGELLHRPTVCDSGQHNTCGCERTWIGASSRKSTTLAHVVYRVGLTRSDYLTTITNHLMQVEHYSMGSAYAEAVELADTAEHFGVGAYVTIRLDGDAHVFTRLETSHA
ncbi:DUF7715 family protein [Nonomuraea wenchangensis]|uniref:DUF7715 family protein n=1 Tax=Nonomuraea wenchangensis TaxID=568860 RepID=UPI0033FCC508